jgi:phage terminase large subunit-like protein
VTDLASLSTEEKLELLQLLEIRDRRQRENMLASYKPYAKQKEFHNAGATYRERLFMAANQCSGPWTWVETPGSKALSVDTFFEPGARVQAWDGESRCVAPVRHGYLKGIEKAYRLVLETGEFFDVTASHQVLTEQGWLSVSRIVSLSSGLRCWQTTEDFLASCVAGGRLHDPRLPLDPGSDPARLLERVGARERSLCFSLEDAEARTRSHTSLLSDNVLHPNAGCDPRQIEALCAQFAGPAMSSSVLPLTGEHQAFLQLARVSHLLPQSGDEPRLLSLPADVLVGIVAGCFSSEEKTALREFSDRVARLSLDVSGPGSSIEELGQDAARLGTFYPFDGPRLVGGRTITAVVPIGYQPILDCHVDRVNCYWAGGVVHHNSGKTLSAAYEIAIHATGRYPDWWQGRRFHRPVSILVGSESGELTRKGLQRLIVGSPQKREEWGTGAIPKECLGNTTMKPGVPDALASVTVKNEYGGESVIQFNSYDQGRSKWQADTIDIVAMDEEPPMDIYTEALTRTNATGGIVFVTFTPLLGMSQVVKRYLTEKPEGTTVIRMTIDDAEHYTPEERARIIAAYPEHEREARTKGVPMLGSGAVFPVAESAISVAPFEIPAHWARINGIDFGWDHPTGFVCMAHDRDTDTVYVYDAWKLKQTPVMTQAGMVVGKGYQNIPWAWPHDGLQHDRNSGEILKDQYQKFGMNMISERAQFENRPDGKPGGNSLEAGVSMMLERMQTRRLRVFSNLEDWFSEFRLYHRKEGIIVKEDDDILSATRYGIMMLRKAKTLLEMEPSRGTFNRPAANLPVFQVFNADCAY